MRRAFGIELNSAMLTTKKMIKARMLDRMEPGKALDVAPAEHADDEAALFEDFIKTEVRRVVLSARQHLRIAAAVEALRSAHHEADDARRDEESVDVVDQAVRIHADAHPHHEATDEGADVAHLPLTHDTKNAPGMESNCTAMMATMSWSSARFNSLMPIDEAISMMVCRAIDSTKNPHRNRMRSTRSVSSLATLRSSRKPWAKRSRVTFLLNGFDGNLRKAGWAQATHQMPTKTNAHGVMWLPTPMIKPRHTRSNNTLPT